MTGEGDSMLTPVAVRRPDSVSHRKTVIVRRDKFDHGLRRIIEQGIADRIFTQTDAKLESFAILGAVNWIPRWFNPEGPASSDEIADRFADFLIAGLRRGMA